MNVADFDFELPADLIAQEATERGRSRLLVLPECGHLPNIEKADAFADAVTTHASTAERAGVAA